MRRRVLIGVAVVLVCAVVVAAGRYEKASASRTQVHGLAHVFALVGPHWATAATAYRLAPPFDCLLYPVRGNPYALELCFDPSGQIVEAVDRRGKPDDAKFWTLRFDEAASTLRVDRATLLRAFIAAGALPKGTTSLPLGHPDYGPSLVRHKKPSAG